MTHWLNHWLSGPSSFKKDGFPYHDIFHPQSGVPNLSSTSISGIYPWVLGLPFQSRMYWIRITSLTREILRILELMDLTWIQLRGIRLLSVHDYEFRVRSSTCQRKCSGKSWIRTLPGSVLFQTFLSIFLPFVDVIDVTKKNWIYNCLSSSFSMLITGKLLNSEQQVSCTWH